MSEDQFILSVKMGLFRGPVFEGVPEEVYDRKQIDFALDRKYDLLGFWIPG